MDSEPVLPQTEPVIEPPTPPTRKFNPLFILVILVLLLAVGTGGIFLGKSLNNSQPPVQFLITPTPLPEEFSVSGFTETTNWKTYLNPQFNFSFKYPANLALGDNSRDATPGTIWVSFADFPFGIQIEELLKTDSKNYLNMPKISERTISGITWEILYFDPKSPEGGGPQTVYQTINKDYRYIVNYNWPQYSTQIDQILSTFKFLNQDQADETANWKIYNSEILSFKYPTNLTLQERQKNYLVLLSDSANPQSVVISIDARLTGNYANYEKAVTSTKAGLTEIQTQEINGGVKIAGKVGPGFGQGQPLTITLFKYREGAIEAETTVTDSTQLRIYNQILSTFKFTDNEKPSYINEPLGFSLNIPASWKDKYKVNILTNSDTTTARFDYQGKTEVYMLFAINRVSSNTWQDLQKDELLKGLANYLGTNKNEVYYSSRSLDNPFTGEDGETYQAMGADIKQIISTFKFLD